MKKFIVFILILLINLVTIEPLFAQFDYTESNSSVLTATVEDELVYLDPKSTYVLELESDLDIDPKIIYYSYADRWLIELVFRRYKSDLRFDDTKVQSDFSVRGAEFVNFISTLITCRIIRIAEKTGLLEQMTYGHLLDELKLSIYDIISSFIMFLYCESLNIISFLFFLFFFESFNRYNSYSNNFTLFNKSVFIFS